jgi:hypothetical protein
VTARDLLLWIVREWRWSCAASTGAPTPTPNQETSMNTWLDIDLRCTEAHCRVPISAAEYHLCDGRCSRCYERATGRRPRKTKRRAAAPPDRVPGQQELF